MALDLYYILLRQGISQNDPTTGNFMYDGDRLYMIDYGRSAYNIDNINLADYMRWAIRGLIWSFSWGWYGDSPLRKEPNTVLRDKIYAELVTTAQQWFKNYFPLEELPTLREPFWP
jgi:hypothetical protein